MQSSTAAKRPKERIVPSRYMQQQIKPSDDKENTAQTAMQHTTIKHHTTAASRISAPLPALPTSATTAASLVKPAVVRSTRTALSTLPPSNNRSKQSSSSIASSSLSCAAAPSYSAAAVTDKPTLPPANTRRRTHDIADHPHIPVLSHRSSLTLNAAPPCSVPLPAAARPQLSDLSLHCHQTALLQSLYWQAAVDRAHNERREAAERQLGAVAAVVRSRLLEERQCQQRIARIRQSEFDHYSLAAQHAAVTPLLPLLQQAAEAHEQLCDVADTLRAQLRLDGVDVDVDELSAELVSAQSVLDDISALLQDECGGPSLASSLSALSPSLSALLGLMAECAPALSAANDDVATLQDRVEGESSVAFAQLAGSSETERQRKRQEAGGRWQW